MPRIYSHGYKKEISLLLGGVGTAFYVSIYGIFLSIWWTFFEKFGMSRFEHDCFTIKEHTKSFFWTKIDIESLHIKSNIENFAKMTNIFEQLTSKNLLDNVNELLWWNFSRNEPDHNTNYSEINLNEIDNKQIIEKIRSFKEETINSNIQTNIENFNEEKELHSQYTKLLNDNIQELNETLQHISSDNLESIYTNIIKSIETMKNEMDRIGWRFNKELDEYDTKFSNKLKSSLESIDEETAKIIEDLKEFKQL